MIRRGRAGGAEVSSTPDQALAASMCGFLLFAQLGNEHIVRFRLLLDRHLFRMAAKRNRPVPPKTLDLLKKVEMGELTSASSADLVDGVLDLAGSSVVSVLAAALSKLTMCRISLLGVETGPGNRPGLSMHLFKLRFDQLRSFVGMDSLAAAQTAEDTATTFRRLFAELASFGEVTDCIAERRKIAMKIAGILRPGQEERPASIVATMLMLDAMDAESRDQYHLGPEAALAMRYGVPRNMLRESIRVLERDGLIRTEQGRTGGVLVGKPNDRTMVDRVVRYFGTSEQPDDLQPLMQDLRMFSMELLLMQPGGDRWLHLAADRLVKEDRDDAISILFAEAANRTRNQLLMMMEGVATALLPQEMTREQQRCWLMQLPGIIDTGGIPLVRRHVFGTSGRG